MKELPSVLQKIRVERARVSIMTGSATRKPRLVGGDKGRNKQISSLPGSPALWARSFTFFRKQFPVLFRRPASRLVAASAHCARKPAPPRMLCIGRIHRGRMTMVVAFPRKGTEEEGNRISKDRGDRHHGSVSEGGKVEGKT